MFWLDGRSADSGRRLLHVVAVVGVFSMANMRAMIVVVLNFCIDRRRSAVNLDLIKKLTK